ncbi:hypothetical protein [Mesorhizobium sp. KR2-14]|uniref:hypothetical protein n=1 Tax=Mesorhizobium sp. KR2-14 TaxID=3156610 RepID=UPI0032B4663B
MKFLSFVQLHSGANARVPPPHEIVAWTRDPLAHPALGGMSQRELGDLPFDRGCQACLDERNAVRETCC